MNLILTLAQTDGGYVQLAKDIGTQFGFHWSLFLSQALSFIIVCALLQKFAYKPILQVLEERREAIKAGLENAEKIKVQLTQAETRYEEILSKANAEAQRMIDEARTSAGALAEKRSQQAITEAEAIVAKAKEATQLEHDRMLSELKREVGRLVIETTAKVTGKVLTSQDHTRINEETVRHAAA